MNNSPTPTPERKCPIRVSDWRKEEATPLCPVNNCAHPLLRGEKVCPCHTPESRLREELVKQMANRFLMWKLPADFSPDGGISFQRMFNEHTPHPMKSEPIGTNLFSATQAEEMVRHMLAGVDLLSQEREALVGAVEKLKKPPTRYDNKKWIEGYNKSLEHVVALLKSKN